MQPDRPPRWFSWLNRSKWWLAATVVLGGLGWWLLVERPMTFYRSAVGASEAHKEALEIQNRALTTGAQIFLGLALVVGAYLTFRRVRALEKQAEATYQGQLTERFTRAIEQLGNKEPAICLGGIYALERIAKDSERDHPQVMEVLCAFVREETRRTDGTDQKSYDEAAENIGTKERSPRPTATVQAALDVIGRTRLRAGRRQLNLLGVQIEGAYLCGADLSGANLADARIASGMLNRAILSKANLSGVDLSGADLSDADLGGAMLAKANLSGADLLRANLSGADLTLTNLSNATLVMADLSGSRLVEINLANANLSMASLVEADLSGADLSRATLVKTNLSKAVLFVGNLSGATLIGANLSEARISFGVRLSEADLTDSDLTGADLTGAILTGADLSGADLSGSDLSVANLSHVRGLTGEQIESAQIDEHTELPKDLLDEESEKQDPGLDTEKP